MKASGIWGVLTVVGVLASVADARADGPYRCGAPYYAYFYPFQMSQFRAEDIPLYALHPPVYYSHIVARPYGYSPYAYYPGIVTPDFELSSPWHPGQPRQPYWDGEGWRWRVAPGRAAEGEKGEKPAPKAAPETSQTAARPRPVIIRNEFFPGEKGGSPKADRLTGKPLRITNPYVTDPVDRQGDDTERVAAAGG